MPSPCERLALRTLLDAVDRHDPGLLALLAGRPTEGVLFGPLAAAGLDDLDVGLLLVALAARLAGRPQLTGDELVAAAAPTSAGRLDALCHLGAESPLLASGLLVPDVAPPHPAEAHATCWRVADHLLRLACEAAGHEAQPRRPLPRGPYRSHGELLTDLRRLSLAYRRRAARIFSLDPWVGVGLDSPDGAEVVARRAREAAAHVASRLAATDDAELPILRLKNEHGLDLDSLVVLVTLLFQELLEGLGVVDAVDLVRLVCESEEDILRRRHMLRPLQSAGLVRLEGSYAGKDLTADASLPERVVDELVGQQAIASDDRIDFHAYLQDLDSSDAFFFDLGFDETS
ncbi:MAG: hypothetical protein DRQ55_08665 [Planctomycetota bacterium]|nr:MAG: hypothetical protein DRQ55_08665 [Planctomycetota bacterium]